MHRENRGDSKVFKEPGLPRHRPPSRPPVTLSIGQLARITGETVKTLRYWTDRGLLQAGRGDNNYRTYSPGAKGRVAFIRNAQGLGLRLETISRLLGRGDEQLPCEPVERELGRRLASVKEEIAGLLELEARLVEVLAEAAAHPCDEQEGCRYLPLQGLTLP